MLQTQPKNLIDTLRARTGPKGRGGRREVVRGGGQKKRRTAMTIAAAALLLYPVGAVLFEQDAISARLRLTFITS